jgi:CheY-like chemotaxis protein
VRDTGLGMTPEVRAHLFEPFFTTKPKETASGLGLSIVYGIIKQFGGGIDVTSREGEGTTFRIFLLRQQPAEISETQISNKPAFLRTVKQILLVEDEEIVREFIREVLEAEGYTVVPAGDGQSALDLFLGRFSNVDMVITDLMLPLMSGRELAERILEVRPEVPILYISGHTNDEVVRREILSARAVFLQKPFRPETLLSKVREASATQGQN